MERYEAYKDSGVEWIGEIPAEWEVRRIKSVASYSRGSGIQRSDVAPDGKPCVRYGELYTTYRNRIIQPLSHIADALWEQSVIVWPNDLIMALTGETKEDIGPTCVNASEYGFAASGDTLVIRPKRQDGRFFAYAMNADYFAIQKYLDASGEIIIHLGSDKVGNEEIVLPPLDQQQTIADYLDAKTAEIDGLVADCEREVELLWEYRKAVISEAVTKGLDPDAPMKDSGIEWIGEIPASWNMMQLGKLCIRIFDGPFGSNLKSNDYVDEGIRVVRLENLKYLQFDATKESYVTPEKYETIRQHTVYPEDLIVATFVIDSVKACRLPKDIGFAVNKADCLGVRTSDEIEVDFLKYFLSSCQVYDFLIGLTHGSTRQRINTTQLKALLTLLPPTQTQNEIIAYLDALCVEIDSLIESKRSMADKLREYRRSLISEAVTGKFKVPGI